MKLIAAIGNPNYKVELESKGYSTMNKDIQYKEGIIEYLEQNKVECIILDEELPGEINIKELINRIKYEIKYILVLLKKDELISFLNAEKISYIQKENSSDLTYIVEYIKKIKTAKTIKQYKKTKQVFLKVKSNSNIEHKKIKIRSYRKINQRQERYRKRNSPKVIQIINLFQVRNQQVEEWIKNKLVLNLFINTKNKKIILEVNRKEIEIKNSLELIKYILQIKMKLKNKKYIFLFIEKEEVLKRINLSKWCYQVIWIMQVNTKLFFQHIRWIHQYNKKFSKMGLWIINHPWKGIDESIIKQILPQYPIIKHKKLREGIDGVSTRKFGKASIRE